MNPLLNPMLSLPLDFTPHDFDQLIASYRAPDGKSYHVEQALLDFRECIKQIYDLNEDKLRETSNANSGTLGKLNRRSTDKRQKAYFNKVENQQPGKTYIRIYAEGDSWFQYPLFVKDIIDWLEDHDDFLIYTDAYGGDWITNILYEGQYIEALTTHLPNVFLVSGGGNDLVGNSRMAVMVSRNPDQRPKHTAETLAGVSDAEVKRRLLDAQPYITKEFYAFIWTMKAQYTILFKGIYENTRKFRDMITIMHGYAYPYPKKGKSYSLRYPLKPVANALMKSGQWLFRPLMLRGILDAELQRSIVMAFIYEFNEMLIDVAANFENVHHIDFRDIPKKRSDWYDEIHLTSHKYQEAAGRIRSLIMREVS